MRHYEQAILFTPGPTNVPFRVLAAGSKPLLHHRSDEFSMILKDVIRKMKEVFETSQDVLIVHTTGRGAMEGAIINALSPGDEILCVCNGKFGEMFADIGEVNGLKVKRMFTDWLEPVDPSLIEENLKHNKDIKAVTITHCDTSTAVINPIKEIGEIVRKYNRLFIVDCISSLGCMEFKFDDWKVDIAITASQKGLMAPTGISFVAINQRAWDAVEKSKFRNYYIDFKDIKDKLYNGWETPGSTPISLVVSVNESLDMIFEEGLKNVYKRHFAISRAIKKSLPLIGFELFPETVVERSPSVTALKVPDGLTSSQIIDMAMGKYGILIASGLGKYKNSVIRIGHMGSISIREAVLLITILENIMYELGRIDCMGKALMSFCDNIKEYFG
ncbi:MAG: alanine--glyoxylate aminotransferase family protein [Firmicutes bacterium]|nr:alanine--glyoxylate aminotransferase family protein [Bacillota bacterium]